MKSDKVLRYSNGNILINSLDRDLNHEELLGAYIVNKDTLSHLIEDNEESKSKVESLYSDINLIDGEMLGIKLKMYDIKTNLEEIEAGVKTIRKIKKIPIVGKAVGNFVSKYKYNKSHESILEEHKNTDYYLYECMSDKKRKEDIIHNLNKTIDKNKEIIDQLMNVNKDYDDYFKDRSE